MNKLFALLAILITMPCYADGTNSANQLKDPTGVLWENATAGGLVFPNGMVGLQYLNSSLTFEPVTIGANLSFNTTTGVLAATAPGTGTVTSVAMTVPAIFSIGGSPITSSGTLALSLQNQSANLVWAGPTTGSSASPTFRALVAADIPSLPYGTGTVTNVTFTGDGIVDSSTPSAPVLTTGTVTATALTQSANKILSGPTSGSAATPTFRLLVSADIPTITLSGDVTGVTGSTTVGKINGISLGSLTSGLLYNTTTSGVPSIATMTQLETGFGTQTVNTIFAGPSTGSAATPNFRGLVAADIPALSYITNFSSGNLSPLFTSSVATATSTPVLSFTLSNAGANTIFGNATGSTASPSYTGVASYQGTASTTFAAGNDSRLGAAFSSPGGLVFRTTSASGDAVATQNQVQTADAGGVWGSGNAAAIQASVSTAGGFFLTTNSLLNLESGLITTIEGQGGKADGKTVTDVVQNGTTTITSASANFTAGDIGKGIALYQGSPQSFSGTTTASSTTVTVTNTANLRAGMFVSQNINASTTGNFIAGLNSFTVSSATGIAIGMTVTGPCVAPDLQVSVTNVSGPVITVSSLIAVTNGSAPVTFNQNLLAAGTTIASITNTTTFVLSAQPTVQGATATMDFIPAQLITTIASVTNSTTAVLIAASNYTGTGTWSTYGTDNTTAIQNALAACNTAGGGSIQAKLGMYCVFGVIQEPTSGGSAAKRNSVILVPNQVTGPVVAINFQGAATPALYSNFQTTYGSSTSGTVIYCPTQGTGTNPCIFGGNASATFSTYSHVQLFASNIEFRKPPQSNLGSFSFLNAGALSFNNCAFDSEGLNTLSVNHVPTPASVVEVLMPNYNNGDFNNVSNCSFVLCGTCLQGASHTNAINSLFGNSAVGISWEPNNGYDISVTNCHFVACGINYANNGSSIAMLMMTGGRIESVTSGPFATTWDFFANTGAIDGFAQMSYSNTGYAPRSNTNVTITAIGKSGGSPPYNSGNYQISPPRMLVNGTNGFKLQNFNSNSPGSVSLYSSQGMLVGQLNWTEAGNVILQGIGSGLAEIMSATNGGLYVTSAGVLTSNGTGFTIPTNFTFSVAGKGIIGAITATLPAAGNVGEQQSSSNAIGSAVPLTTATAKNVIVLNLTAGHWFVTFSPNIVSTTSTMIIGSPEMSGISTTTNTLPTDGTEGYTPVALTLATQTNTVPCSGKFVNLTGSGTVYGVVQATFTAGTEAAFGSLTATRLP